MTPTPNFKWKRLLMTSPVLAWASILVALSSLPLSAQSTGYWQFVRAEGFESQVYNTTCVGEIVKSEQLAGNLIQYTHTVPGSCNYDKPARDIHMHHFTTLQDTIQVGTSPLFATDSEVSSLVNTVAPFGATSIFGGWVAYDVAPNVGPNMVETLAYTTASNAAGVGSKTFSSTEQTLPELRFKMPAAPWFGSDRNNGMIRFRIFLYTGSIWRMVDRIYQWTPGSTGACTGSCGVGSAQTAGPAGGTLSIPVTATGQWDAVAADPWISITPPASGNGNGTLTISVTPNPGATRTGSVRVAGKTVTITQIGGAEAKLFEISNIAGCSTTTHSEFTLTGNSLVSRLSVWYKFNSDEFTVPYTLLQGNQTVRSGTLLRNSCDPFQTSWCVAQDTAVAVLPAGDYRINVSNSQICQNPGSQGKGFVGIFGSLVNTGAASGSCSGTCSLGAPGQPIDKSGGTGTIAVTATGNWTAVPFHDWIKLTSGTSGSGNGSVGFNVDPNTGAPRSGVISAAGQTYGIHQAGTASGTSAGCSYLIQSNSTIAVPIAGTTSGLIQVVTNQSCAWTSSTDAAWITLRSGTSSTGNGAVAFNVASNDTGSQRSAAIVIAGQVVVVNQAGGAPPGTPVISQGGVVNTASYAPGGPPNGALAQGSFFSIYGSDLGPDQFAKAPGYPLPTSLGGVSVAITTATTRADAYLVFTSKGQINAILSSAVPVGDAQVVISYNGKTGSPAAIRVVKTSVGVFFQRVDGKDLAIAQNIASATDYPLNLPDTPAKPGQIVILWVTGVGPVSVADNGAPGGGDMTGVPVTITVGGIAAQRLYAGRQPETSAVDNIYFTVPSNAPLGCQIPVAVTAGGTPANTTYIAISANGSRCQ